MGDVVILGVGNILLRDEGVGVHVIHELEKLAWPPEVRLVDGGTAAFDLLPFLGPTDKVIIVDAVRAGGSPGTLYRLTLEDLDLGEQCSMTSVHQLGLKEALELARLRGLDLSVVILGVEPERVESGIGLTATLKAKLPELITAVRKEVVAFCKP